MALEQNPVWTESVDEESTQRDRLCTAVQFLLNCFGSMHHLKMSKSICFVLEDVRAFLLGMNSTTRMEAFSKLPFITMDDLGFIKNLASARLDWTIVTKDELLLLFVVCHLSLNGKSHFEEVVKDLRNLAPLVVSMNLSSESPSERLGYLRKYTQYFQLDGEGYVELASTFFSPFRESFADPVSSKTDGFLHCEDDAGSCSVNEEIIGAEANRNIGNLHSIMNNFFLPDNNSCSNESHFVGIDTNFRAETSSLETSHVLSPEFDTSVINSFDVVSNWIVTNTSLNAGSVLPERKPSLNNAKNSEVDFFSKTEFPLENDFASKSKHFSCNAREAIDEATAEVNFVKDREQNNYFQLEGGSNTNKVDINNSTHCKSRVKLKERLKPHVVLEYETSCCSASNTGSCVGTIDFLADGNASKQKDKCSFSSINSAMAEKDFISKRIMSSVSYLQMFFNLRANKRSWCIILQVLSDVKAYFINLSYMEQVDLIQKTLVSGSSKNNERAIPFCSVAWKGDLLTSLEEEMLYFYSKSFSREIMHYTMLFDTYLDHNKLIKREIPNFMKQDFEILSYFKNLNNLFSVDENGVVKPTPLPSNLNFLENFPSYVFKSYDWETFVLTIKPVLTTSEMVNSNRSFITAAGINVDEKTVSRRLESQDIWCKDNLLFKKLCELVCFLLLAFGTQDNYYLMRCISYVFPEMIICFEELPAEKRLKVFSCIPCTVLNNGTYLQLTTSYQFKIYFTTKSKLCKFYIVSYLALHGETHFLKLMEDIYGSELGLKIVAYKNAKDLKWQNYLTRSKLWEFGPNSYLTLSASFYSNAHKIDALLQTVRSKNDSSTSKKPYCLKKELKIINNDGNAVPENVDRHCESFVVENPVLSNDNYSDNSASEVRSAERESAVHVNLEVVDRICTLIRKGVMFLFQHFKCSLNLNIFCVALHALHQAKHPFRLLPQPEKVAMINKILAPLWNAGVADDLGTFFTHSSETSELNNVQRCLLFISYIVGQSGKLHFSTLLDVCEKHNMDLIGFMSVDDCFDERSAVFSRDAAGYISLVNFPPSMPERLSAVLSGDISLLLTEVPRMPRMDNTNRDSFGNFAVERADVTETGSPCMVGIITKKGVKQTAKATKTKNVSPSVNLSFTIHDSIAYLINFFRIEINSGFLEVVLHVAKDRAMFFNLPTCQQKKVIVASFCAFRVDEHGRIASTYTKNKRCKLDKDARMPLCMAYFIHHMGPMHYREVFKCYKNYVGDKYMKDSDQLVFFKERRDLFFVSGEGHVNLVNVPTIDLDYVSVLMPGINRSSVTSNVSIDKKEDGYCDYGIVSPNHVGTVFAVNSDASFEDCRPGTIDQMKQVPEKYDTPSHSKLCGKSLKLYSRIQESVICLTRTFEVVSVKDIMRTLFHVLHDVRNLFAYGSDRYRNILEEIDAFVSERKVMQLQMNKPTTELTSLSEEEKDLLVLSYILIQFGPMHHSELFKTFEVYEMKIKSMSSRYNLLYLKKNTEYFAIDSEEAVSLNESYNLTPLNLDGYFKDMDLNASFRSKVIENNVNYSPEEAATRHKKIKSFSGCMQRDLLYEIYDMCNDIITLHKKMLCIAKFLHEQENAHISNAPTKFREDSSTMYEETKLLNVAKLDFAPKEANFIEIKPADGISTKHLINENVSTHTKWGEYSNVPCISDRNQADMPHRSNCAKDIKMNEHDLSLMDSIKILPFSAKYSPNDFSSHSNVNQVYNNLSKGQSRVDYSDVLENDLTVATPYVDQNASGSSKVYNKPINRETVENFNVVELQSNDEQFSNSVKPDVKRKVSNCNCTKNSAKECRTRNFFIIILGQSKIGLSVPVLTEKLLLASSEVQHYISCVYKGNIQIFLQNHEKFYILPSSGNICCKK